MANRKYSAGTITGMVFLSQGSCYWPKCREPLVRFEAGLPVNNFETAHIRALNPGGPRHDGTLSPEELNQFSNLVLLCVVHHKIVDKLKPWEYPTSTLQTWKIAREADGHASLKGLGDLTEDRLQEMINSAFTVFGTKLDSALDRLELIDLEAASLLRPLIDDLKRARFEAWYPSEEVAQMLQDAARRMGNLEENALLLSGAAKRLSHLRETVDQLERAANRIGRANGYM